MPVAAGLTRDSGFPPVGQKNVAHCPVNRFKLQGATSFI